MDTRQGMCRGCARAPSLSFFLTKSSRKHNKGEKLLRDKNLPPLLNALREDEYPQPTPFGVYLYLSFISGSFINHLNRRESVGRTRKIKRSHKRAKELIQFLTKLQQQQSREQVQQKVEYKKKNTGALGRSI